MSDASPTVIVLAGPNGAGKTTTARTVLAETLQLRTYVNADVIAQGLSGFDPESMAIKAGRIMLEQLHTLAAERANFAFETTLAGRTYAGWLKELRKTGYTVHLYYFWLGSADLAIARVATRVQFGGHDIPEETIRRRYRRSVANFFDLYRQVASAWDVYDNTEEPPARLVAFGDCSGDEIVMNQDVWERFRKSTS